MNLLQKVLSFFLCSILLGSSSIPAASAWNAAEPKAIVPSIQRPAAQSLTIQQGSNGYTGAADASLFNWNPNSFYGATNTLDTQFGKAVVGLLRFDLSAAIPTNSQIHQATLSLYVTASTSRNNTQRPAEVHALKVNWRESEVNWNQRMSGQPWSGSGPQAGTDYEKAAQATSAVGAAGSWVTWDLTPLVQEWVRNPGQNFGILLLDTNGYNFPTGDDGTRAYASSNHGTTGLRPKLTVDYDPDTPLASAGADFINLEWNGSAITLDGSASHDRPGGDNNHLTYQWQITSAAYGSQRSGVLTGCARTCTFQPDIAGDWTVQLTVTNALGFAAQDSVQFRIWRLTQSHPRIYLSTDRLAILKAKQPADPTWQRWNRFMTNSMDPTAAAWTEYPAMHYGLMYQILKDTQPTQAAHWAELGIHRMQTMLAQTDPNSLDYCAPNSFQRTAYCVLELSFGYDWLHDYSGFTQSIKTSIQNAVIPRINWTMQQDLLAFHNENYLNVMTEGMAGMAFYGDLSQAVDWLNHARYDRYETLIRPALSFVSAEGGGPEGEQYAHAYRQMIDYAIALRSATGEDLFSSSPYFTNMIDHYLHATSNDWIGDWDRPYRMHNKRGDMDTRYVTFHDYTRQMLLMTWNGLHDSPQRDLIQSYLTSGPNGETDQVSAEQFSIWDYLWAGPWKNNVPNTWNNQPLAYNEKGLGLISARSSWDPDAVWVTFQAGDHFTTHQHFDQGHFTIYRGGWLAVESGTYDGWCTEHLINYYHQSIAHNTIAVNDPSEPYGGQTGRICADGYPTINTEGQRAFDASPYTTEPPSVDAWKQNAAIYDTADMTHYVNAQDQAWTYAQGDITKAYTDKIQQFVREFLFIRPGWVITYDRVRVRDSSLTPRWLLHTVNEPNIAGTTITTTNGNWLDGQASLSNVDAGKLFVRSLLPEQPVIQKIGGVAPNGTGQGGASQDAWVGGENFPPAVGDRQDPGFWRIEISSSTPSVEQRFFNVMYTAGIEATSMPKVEKIHADGMDGAALAGDPSWVILFQTGSDAPNGPLTYHFTSATASRHLLFNLRPDQRYDLTTQEVAGGFIVTLTPNPAGLYSVNQEGVLSFSLDTSGIPPDPVLSNFLPLILR
jgi:hypothetical protein